MIQVKANNKRVYYMLKSLKNKNIINIVFNFYLFISLLAKKLLQPFIQKKLENTGNIKYRK